MLRGYGADLQRTLAKAQSRKIWLRVSRGPLQKGQTQALASLERIDLPIFALEEECPHQFSIVSALIWLKA
jgi:hypothetical protein